MPGQIVDFAGMVHAHFQHCVAMRRVHAQQHERQTDVVIEIAFGGENGVIQTRFGAQNLRRHFLDGGLAVAAGNGNDRNGKA